MIKRLSIFVGLGFVLMACTMADLEGTPVNGKGVASNTKGSSEQTCTGGSTSTPTTLPPQNPDDFPKCACASGGKARCIPKGVLPDSLSAQLEACSDGGPGGD